MSLISLRNGFPVDTGRKLNVHKTFRRCPGRHLNFLYTFNLHPVSTGLSNKFRVKNREWMCQKLKTIKFGRIKGVNHSKYNFSLLEPPFIKCWDRIFFPHEKVSIHHIRLFFFSSILCSPNP